MLEKYCNNILNPTHRSQRNSLSEYKENSDIENVENQLWDLFLQLPAAELVMNNKISLF